jgi:hypothetical protein
MTLFTLPEMRRLREMRDDSAHVAEIMRAFPGRSRDELIRAWHALTLNSLEQALAITNQWICREAGKEGPPVTATGKPRYFEAAR